MGAHWGLRVFKIEFVLQSVFQSADSYLTEVKRLPKSGDLIQLNVSCGPQAYGFETSKIGGHYAGILRTWCGDYRRVGRQHAGAIDQSEQERIVFRVRRTKGVLDEMVFAGNEMFDRTRTETHLLSEFASKTAGSHSVKDLKTMGMECTQHQLDFIRRDCERVFKHSERMIETAANLFNSRPQV
jgi:hypothetical protein